MKLLAYLYGDSERFLSGAPLLDDESCYPIGLHNYNRVNIGFGLYFNSLDGLRLYFDFRSYNDFFDKQIIKQNQ